MECRFRLVAAALFVGLSVMSARALAASRVALIHATDGDAQAAQIVSLAETLVGQQNGVQLIERQQIERVLREQQISLSGVVDAEHAIKVGRIVSADLLASVETSPGSRAIGLVVFDAASGVRLSDRTITAADDGETAQAIANGVLQAISKRQHSEKVRTICLLSVRNADLPAGMDGFCDALGRLLERNLVRSDGVALLERSRLEQVTRERALSEQASREQLLASVILVNLDVSRSEHGIVGTALLSDAAGRSLGKVKSIAAPEKAAELAAALAESITHQIKLPNAIAPLDTSAEAARFGAEAEFRIAHVDFVRAIAPAEAAHALDPSNLRYHALLAQSLIDSAKMIDYGVPIHILPKDLPIPSLDQIPAMAAHGAETLAGTAIHYDSVDRANQIAVDRILDDATEELCEYVNWAFIPRRKISPLDRPTEFAQIRTALRQYLLRVNARHLAAVRDAKSFQLYSKQFVQLLSDIQWMAASSSDQWTSDYSSLSQQWLSLFDRYPDANSQQVRDALRAISIDWALERHRGPRVLDRDDQLLRWDLTSGDYARLEAIADALSKQPDEVAKRYSGLAALTIAVVQVQRSPDAMDRLVSAYREEAERRIARPEMQNRPDARRMEYDLVFLAGALLEKTKYARQTANSILDFMLARKDYYRPFMDYLAGKRFRPIADEATEERLADLERENRIVAAMDTAGFFNLSDHKNAEVKASSLNNIRMLEHPEGVPAVRVATTQTWLSKRTLIDVFDSLDGIQWLVSPVVHDGTVYAAGVNREGVDGPASLQLISIPLDGKPLRLGAELPFKVYFNKSDPRKNTHVANNINGVTDAVVFKGIYSVATERYGLYLFPLDGSSPSILDESNGLPSSNIRRLAGMDGILYLGIGLGTSQGYLVAYDMHTKKVDVLASSVRQDKRSPFDDTSAFEVSGIVPDPIHHRIVLVIYQQGSSLSGVWEYKPTASPAQHWRQLAAISPRPRTGNVSPANAWMDNPLKYVGSLEASCFLIGFDFTRLYAFDTSSDRVERLYHTAYQDFIGPGSTELPRYPNETDAAEKGLLGRLIVNRLCVIDGDWIWDQGLNPRPWGRTNLKTGERQVFGNPRGLDISFKPEFICPAGNGEVVFGDQFGLWATKPLPAHRP